MDEPECSWCQDSSRPPLYRTVVPAQTHFVCGRCLKERGQRPTLLGSLRADLRMNVRNLLSLGSAHALAKLRAALGLDERFNDVVQQLNGVAIELKAVRRLVEAPVHHGSVVVLWQDEGTPRMASRSVAFHQRGEQQSVVFDELYHPVPAGAWVVAHDCRLERVFVGNLGQDCSPVSRGRLCVLTDSVTVGTRLGATVLSPYPSSTELR